MIGTFVIDFPLTSLMFWAWKPDPVAGLGNEAAQADGEKA
jgi:p-aminobenzoyl-glutamate transporter AbgT